MRLLNDGVLYEFTVEHNPNSNSVMRYRKFQHPHRRAVSVIQHSLDLSETPQMLQILSQHEIPPVIARQMADHFGFFADRLVRRSRASDSGIQVSVRLDVKLLAPDTAGGIRERMESSGVAPRRRREVEEDVQFTPARRSAVEALERVRVEEGGWECAVCLEENGKEATKMPCGHMFHRKCITEWLQRTHFCPFCRYKMPCAPP